LAQAQDSKEILAQLTKITGLAIVKPVDQQTMRRDQLKEYFEARIKEVVKPEEIRVEELTLKLFGFAPPQFDLKKTTVDLMAEQAAAFYDYRKRKMVLLEGGEGGAMAEMALIHELAHALADQHFNLERFLKKANSSDDASLARTAVMEGQATYLMSEFMAQKMGQSLKESPSMVDMMARMAAAGGSGFPVFESVPLYMRESLVFPYSRGMVFQHKAVEKYGQKGFAEVFQRPPATTREILHPEVYFDRTPPTPVKVPTLPTERGWKKVAEGTVGEFDFTVLLKQYARDHEALGSEWRGGRYQVWERRQGRGAVLAHASAWSDEGRARGVLAAYREVLKGKSKECSFSEDGAARLAGKADSGHFWVRVDGAVVAGVEGWDSPQP
jgi:hypothetical protein